MRTCYQIFGINFFKLFSFRVYCMRDVRLDLFEVSAVHEINIDTQHLQL